MPYGAFIPALRDTSETRSPIYGQTLTTNRKPNSSQSKNLFKEQPISSFQNHQRRYTSAYRIARVYFDSGLRDWGRVPEVHSVLSSGTRLAAPVPSWLSLWLSQLIEPARIGHCLTHSSPAPFMCGLFLVLNPAPVQEHRKRSGAGQTG